MNPETPYDHALHPDPPGFLADFRFLSFCLPLEGQGELNR